MVTVKATPLTRQELQRLLVTDADAFTVLRYLRHREMAPRLPELEEQGETRLPGAAGVLADLYYSLWAPEPGLQEAEQVRPDRRYWHELFSQTTASAAFEELHAKTALRELMAVLGTIAMGEEVLAVVPDEDREKLEELAEAQQQADSLDEQAQQAQAQAQAAQQLADAAAQQASQGQPQSGQAQQGQGTMTAEQAKAVADALAAQAAQAQTRAEALQQQASASHASAESLADNLMGAPGSKEAADKSRELARMGHALVNAAQQQTQEVSDTLQAWGVEAGELTRQNFEEVAKIRAALQRNPALKQFQALLGRLRQIAARKAMSKLKGEGVRESRLEMGRDISRAATSELVSLTNPALRVQALTRWTRGELQLHGERVRQKLGKGPVIVCEDGSGSMDGLKQQWTKALVLALATYAKVQKRSFGWILFDAIVHRAQVYPKGAVSAAQMIEIAQSRAGGGTSFEAPLRVALKMAREQGLKKADIVLVTDGMCAVSSSFLRELMAVKRALEINIITVLVNVGETADATVREFSDRIILISELSVEEAGRKIIGIL